MVFTSTLAELRQDHCFVYFHTKQGKGPGGGNLPAGSSHRVNPNYTMAVGNVTELCIPRASVPGRMTPSQTVFTTGMKLGNSCCTTSARSAEPRMQAPSHVQAPCLPAQPKKRGLRMTQSHMVRIRLWQSLGKYKKKKKMQQNNECLYTFFNELTNDNAACKAVPRKFLKQHY